MIPEHRSAENRLADIRQRNLMSGLRGDLCDASAWEEVKKEASASVNETVRHILQFQNDGILKMTTLFLISLAVGPVSHLRTYPSARRQRPTRSWPRRTCFTTPLIVNPLVTLPLLRNPSSRSPPLSLSTPHPTRRCRPPYLHAFELGRQRQLAANFRKTKNIEILSFLCAERSANPRQHWFRIVYTQRKKIPQNPP